MIIPIAGVDRGQIGVRGLAQVNGQASVAQQAERTRSAIGSGPDMVTDLIAAHPRRKFLDGQTTPHEFFRSAEIYGTAFLTVIPRWF
jgi:hypothetical protein